MRVIDKIEEERNARIQEINSDVEKRIGKLEEQFQLKWEKAEKEERSAFDIEFNKEKEKIRNLNQLKISMNLLREKQILIDDLLDNLYSDIVGDENLYIHIIQNTVLQGVSMGMKEILVSEKDTEFLNRDLLKNLEEFVKEKTGQAGNFYIGNEKIAEPGVIMVNGRRRINGSVRAYVDEFKRNNIVKISERVFGNGSD